MFALVVLNFTTSQAPVTTSYERTQLHGISSTILSCAAKRTMKNMNYTKLMLRRMGYILITIYYWTRIPCIHGTITLGKRRKVRERKMAFSVMKHNSLNNVSTTRRHWDLQTRIHYFWRENFQKKNWNLERENYLTTENISYAFFIHRSL